MTIKLEGLMTAFILLVIARNGFGYDIPLLVVLFPLWLPIAFLLMLLGMGLSLLAIAFVTTVAQTLIDRYRP